MRWMWLLFAASVLGAQSPESIEKQKAAAVQQRASVRRQAESLNIWKAPQTAPATPVADEPCEAITETAVSPLIEEAARAQSVEPKLLRAVIEQESAFRPCAVSAKGAKGLMQLMPDTASDMGVKDPFDPKESISGGAKYLKLLLDKYNGNLAQALGAYNAGPTTVDHAGGVPDIAETRDYVKAIMDRLAPK